MAEAHAVQSLGGSNLGANRGGESEGRSIISPTIEIRSIVTSEVPQVRALAVANDNAGFMVRNWDGLTTEILAERVLAIGGFTDTTLEGVAIGLVGPNISIPKARFLTSKLRGEFVTTSRKTESFEPTDGFVLLLVVRPGSRKRNAPGTHKRWSETIFESLVTQLSARGARRIFVPVREPTRNDGGDREVIRILKDRWQKYLLRHGAKPYGSDGDVTYFIVER